MDISIQPAGTDDLRQPTAADPGDPCDLLEVADADSAAGAMDLTALRARARKALIGEPGGKPNDPNSPHPDEAVSALNGPKTASGRKSPEFSWGRFALGLAAGSLAGVGALAVLSSL